MSFEQSEKNIDKDPETLGKDTNEIIKKNGVVITNDELSNIFEDPNWWKEQE